MIRLLWRTDGHLSDHTPTSRTDVWSDTILGKIRQIGQLASSYQCHAVLDGGDLFHDKTPGKTSHALMSRLYEVQRAYPCPTYGNVGNHDCRLGQFEFLQEGPLGSLFSSGVMHPCFNDHEAHFRDHGVHVRVVGIPYHGPKYNLDRFRSLRKGSEDHLIVMAHVLASPQGGDMFANEDIIRYQDLLTLCPEASVFCFLPGTQVLDWNGRPRDIEFMDSGPESVEFPKGGPLRLMGRHGEPVTVEKVHPVRLVDEEVVQFDVEGVPTTLIPGVTLEHPFWVARDLNCVLPSRSTRRCHPDKSMSSYPCNTCTKQPEVLAGWVGAGEVQEGDFIAIPIPAAREEVNSAAPGLARLLGYYLSEGHLINNNRQEPFGGVGWTQNLDRIGFYAEVKQLVAEHFGLITHTHPQTDTGGTVCAYGQDVAKWFGEHGGRYSHKKALAPQVWGWSEEARLEVLLGWLVGDGHARTPERYDRIKSEVMGATVSSSLASQMFLLALGLGLRPYYTIRPEQENHLVLGHLVEKTREVHIISFYGDDADMLASKLGKPVPERSKTKVSGFFKDGLYFARVRGVSRRHYKGPVYNMRTSNQEYVAGLLVTHNCFGHWHKDQGVADLGLMQVVNVGSFSRGSLSQDNLDRIPSVALLRCSKDRVEIEQIPLRVDPPAQVFDLRKRATEELQTAIVDRFVRTLQTDLRAKSSSSLPDILVGLRDVPAQVRERALAYLERNR